MSTLLGPVWLSCRTSIQNWIYAEEGIQVTDLTIIIISGILILLLIVGFIAISRSVYFEAVSNIVINLFYSVMGWVSFKYLLLCKWLMNTNNISICCQLGDDASTTPDCPIYISKWSILAIITACIIRSILIFKCWKPQWVQSLLARRELKQLKKQYKSSIPFDPNNQSSISSTLPHAISPRQSHRNDEENAVREHLLSFPRYQQHHFPDI